MNEIREYYWQTNKYTYDHKHCKPPCRQMPEFFSHKIQFQICCKLYFVKESSQMYFANNFIKTHLNRIIINLSGLPQLD